ncbi:MAG: AAA family ATPase, partial [Actinomycetota bacterium]|nr:AAA family ATPase [Actinomycetota bacterium]
MERKLATVLFVDLVDSTMLVADADPEVVRRRVSSFFDQVSRCIITHGGTVEKFAGDAVMAAFGVPLAHEDDAERAVRAGLATLEKVAELGLQARIGIESGEVVTEDGESTFATGEAVNLASRLQAIAGPNEIVVGPGAASLIRGRVELESLGDIDVRGWREPVAAHRVVCAVELSEPLRSLSAPLVGRESELELLENTYERAVRDKRAALFTIYGDPGVGKSRLAREFVAGLEGATVLIGRCLPYGEGVTYWPLAEMVKAASGITDDDPLDEAQRKLRACCEDEAVADLLGLAVGVLEAVEGERSQQEIAWAARAWAEQLAEAQPLVLVFEDVHWGEEPLLELLEHLAASVREAPLMIVGLARPELLDIRPTWGGGRVRATTLELEPLQAEESAVLVEALIGELELPLDIATVLAKTEGNPLFMEETVRMLAERPRGGTERIPDTLQALIAARIDRLPAASRVVLQRASVMGRIFMGGALSKLTPELDDVGEALDDLLVRDLVVREVRATISGEHAYKFKHVLIREVAYAGLSKTSRADLHRAFAEWLGERAGDELLEIRAFHLDQAARLLAELDGAAPAELREEAAEALTNAGRRALSRESYRSARKLLLRAVELAPTLERRYLAGRAAWRLADFPAVLVEMGEVASEAEQAGETRVQGRALTALAEAVLQHRADAVTARRLVGQAVDVLAGDEPSVRFEPLWISSTVAAWFGDYPEFERWAKLALEAAREAERKDLEALVTHGLVTAYVTRLELAEAAPLLLRAMELADQSGSLFSRATALSVKGWVELVSERYVEAEEEYTAARELFTELGNSTREAVMTVMVGRAAFAQGDFDRAEKLLRDAVRALKGIGDRGTLCEALRALAMVLVEQDNLDEAERFALEAQETVGREDRVSISSTKLGLGIVRAAQKRDEEAEELMLEAVEGFALYELRALEHWALRYLAQFLRSRGREDEAVAYEARRAALSP